MRAGFLGVDNGETSILAIAIMIAGVLSGGVYSVSGSTTTGAVVVDRFTGTVWSCSGNCAQWR